MLPVTVNVTGGVLVTTKVIELVLLVQAVGSRITSYKRFVVYGCIQWNRLHQEQKQIQGLQGSNVGVLVCVSKPPSILKVYELEATPPVIVNMGVSPVQIVRLKSELHHLQEDFQQEVR